MNHQSGTGYAGSVEIQVTILAAGLGTRLGQPYPKPLTPLADGRCIMQHQLDKLRESFPAAPVIVVVGFRPDLIMGAFPDLLFAYNDRYEATNTAKSLLRALQVSGSGGMLWLNGDVVFDRRLLAGIKPLVDGDETFVCVNTAAVGEEEVKYRLGPEGYVTHLSKSVTGGFGEAVGINYISRADKATLIQHLERCTDQDYFERGIETAIVEDGLRVRAVDISEFFAVEVDFPADLERANAEVSRTVTSAA